MTGYVRRYSARRFQAQCDECPWFRRAVWPSQRVPLVNAREHRAGVHGDATEPPVLENTPEHAPMALL